MLSLTQKMNTTGVNKLFTMPNIKFLETSSGEDVKTVILDLEKNKPCVSQCFSPSNEEPIAIRIIPSGWSTYYHVLIEYGDFEQVDHFLLTAEQLMERYDIDIASLEKEEVIINAEDIKSHANDTDLGIHIRKTYKQSI